MAVIRSREQGHTGQEGSAESFARSWIVPEHQQRKNPGDQKPHPRRLIKEGQESKPSDSSEACEHIDTVGSHTIGAFSKYQPTSCPKGINVVAITANNGTTTVMASSIPVQLGGIAGTPQTWTSTPPPRSWGNADIVRRRGEIGVFRINVSSRRGAIIASS
jgi:hypothetical protein